MGVKVATILARFSPVSVLSDENCTEAKGISAQILRESVGMLRALRCLSLNWGSPRAHNAFDSFSVAQAAVIE